MKFDTLLFDLDGTLVDTAPDLVESLNVILKKYNHPIKKYNDAKKLVSKGGKALIKFGFNIDETHPNFLAYHTEFLEYYTHHIADKSRLFDGMDEIINSLKNWGIITNKPEKLTHLLLDKLNLKPDVVVCGDTLDENKPSSKPITHAMEKLGIKNTLMIGDDEVDSLAAKNAGIKSVLVSWGYSNLENVESDYFIKDVSEIKQWFF